MSTRPPAQPRLHCTAEADGRITFDLAPGHPERARLALVLRPGKGRPETTRHLLDLERHGADGHSRAVLEARTVLEEGRWDAYLLSAADTGAEQPGQPGAERQRLRPGLRDLRRLVDGGLRDRPSPVAVRVPYATMDGFFAIRAWLRPAHAEAGRIDIAHGAMTVHARLHGAELTDEATVRLRLRGSRDTLLGFRPVADGRDFSFTAAFDELVGASGGVPRVWDAFLQPAAGAPLIRIGRLLDDVADRKRVWVYPRTTVEGAAVCPYYTVDNDLAVEVASG
ncbi:transferase [Streptomyces sp. NPDC052012]|uniref:transferase n=1 Tax=Streptomyces sp. NPDC052012 TaxID=3155051 RepID=UPI00344E18A1